MNFLLKTLCVLILLFIASGITAVMLMLENEPSVPGTGLAAGDLQNARIFIENSDPRRLQPGELSDFTISERDLEMLVNYLLDHLEGGRSQVALGAGTADLRLSVRQPVAMLEPYLNLRVVFLQQADVLALDSLQAGRLTIPGWIADPLMQRTHMELLRRVPEYRDSIASIRSFDIADERLNIVYEWQPELLQQLSTRGGDLLLGDADRARLVAHTMQLNLLVSEPAAGTRRMQLVDVLGPMFAFARERRGDPVEENRAALLVMGLYISETSMAPLLGGQVPELPQRTLLLAGRADRAQHFLISAALAVSAGTGAAQSLGMLKEVDDSRDGGSGFSFVDIGADRTGIRFGELAVAGPDQARTLQERVATMTGEELFMADFRDLPELLTEASFEADYGGAGEPAYEEVVREIDARIDEMPLFR